MDFIPIPFKDALNYFETWRIILIKSLRPFALTFASLCVEKKVVLVSLSLTGKRPRSVKIKAAL